MCFTSYLIKIMALTIIILSIASFGDGSPLFDGSSNWLDKIPSIEVKVRTDGVSVKTGPSREEIYTLLGYVLLGLVLFVTIAILLTICTYKCCWKQRYPPHITIHGAVPETGSHFPLYSTQNNGGRFNRQTTHLPSNVHYGAHASTIVGTHYSWPKEQNNLVQSTPYRSTR